MSSPYRLLRPLAVVAVVLLFLVSLCDRTESVPILIFNASANASTSLWAQLINLGLQNKVDKLAVIMNQLALQGVTSTNVTTVTNTGLPTTG